MPAPTTQPPAPRIDPATLVRAVLARQREVDGIRLMKLAYLAEVRYRATHPGRLTGARWWSWKAGPDSREVAAALSSLPANQSRPVSRQRHLQDVTRWKPAEDTRPTLPADLDRFFDELLGVYGAEATPAIVTAAYRSTPFQRTASGRRINLDSWGPTPDGDAVSAETRSHLAVALRSERIAFGNERELADFLEAARGLASAKT